ncbi:MAG: FHA domain-containing protein [Bdellovibrionaceae bacterium]|nr:FHA domain-containing protein [Pseudobdellovibrionaceae bacterium]
MSSTASCSSDDSSTETTKIVFPDKTGLKGDKKDRRPPSLTLIKGPAPFIGKQWMLNKKSMTLGRFATSEIQITEGSLSKAHARVTVVDGVVSIADLGATNGTSINGKILTPYSTYQLRHNDQIKAGGLVFKFQDET